MINLISNYINLENMTKNITVLERFHKFIDKTESCWFWKGCKVTGGYGEFWNGKKYVLAHRFSYEIHKGKIPDGLHIDHLCRIRNCMNPDHMEPVTKGTNTLRGFSPSAINARKTSCKNGHELSGENLGINSNKDRFCKICHKILVQQWQQQNKDKIKINNTKYQLKKKLRKFVV
jgi:hypothetical protein